MKSLLWIWIFAAIAATFLCLYMPLPSAVQLSGDALPAVAAISQPESSNFWKQVIQWLFTIPIIGTMIFSCFLVVLIILGSFIEKTVENGGETDFLESQVLFSTLISVVIIFPSLLYASIETTAIFSEDRFVEPYRFVGAFAESLIAYMSIYVALLGGFLLAENAVTRLSGKDTKLWSNRTLVAFVFAWICFAASTMMIACSVPGVSENLRDTLNLSENDD